MRLEKVLLGGGNPVLEVVGRSGHRLFSWMLALMKAWGAGGRERRGLEWGGRAQRSSWEAGAETGGTNSGGLGEGCGDSRAEAGLGVSVSGDGVLAWGPCRWWRYYPSWGRTNTREDELRDPWAGWTSWQRMGICRQHSNAQISFFFSPSNECLKTLCLRWLTWLVSVEMSCRQVDKG